ncbi:MAG: two-component system, OmpR family, alkaline phosphatase synthesis response regulator PhoP [Gaiellaceae bacterium]|jgi:DNA-binding response OmpR family regulator|nr:two-component system, OmpR family, alkaline phosphatase synthesis response regulator PhoP [Gaiellaceae bacterium]
MRAGTALVVEDEDSIASLVRSYLERDGFAVVRARTGEEALAELERRPVRVVVLDIGLPDMDGFEVCRSIRTHSRVPILMLTARDEEPDRVSGLELGADDYVTKPFSPRELLARVRAVLRRAETWFDEPELAFADVVVRRDAREVTVAGETVELTGKEFDLLTILLSQPNVVLTRELLLDRVWGLTFPGGTRTVDVHVASLRRKLARPELVVTVRGVGYKVARE